MDRKIPRGVYFLPGGGNAILVSCLGANDVWFVFFQDPSFFRTNVVINQCLFNSRIYSSVVSPPPSGNNVSFFVFLNDIF